MKIDGDFNSAAIGHDQGETGLGPLLHIRGGESMTGNDGDRNKGERRGVARPQLFLPITERTPAQTVLPAVFGLTLGALSLEGEMIPPKFLATRP